MIELILKIVLALFCVQGLVKFGAGFLVPYETRIGRIGAYYENDERVIRIYDNVILVIIIAVVALLLASGLEYLNFTAGLVVGMLLIQVFFHRFVRVLPEARAPKPPVPPIKLMSFAIQDAPQLAWREILIISILLISALWMLLTHL